MDAGLAANETTTPVRSQICDARVPLAVPMPNSDR